MFEHYRWTVPKYRSNSIYTSSYKRHPTAQYEQLELELGVSSRVQRSRAEQAVGC